MRPNNKRPPSAKHAAGEYVRQHNPLIKQRKTMAVDPFGYSHVCDHAASYHPRVRSKIDPMDQ